VTSELWDVVVVPFPFSDVTGGKRRPALVISTATFNASGHTVLAMVTTPGHRPWPGDCPLDDSEKTGLPARCVVRMKLFTVDNRLLVRLLGRLNDSDAARVKRSLDTHLC
jgi:mRNA interferase MazF